MAAIIVIYFESVETVPDNWDEWNLWKWPSSIRLIAPYSLFRLIALIWMFAYNSCVQILQWKQNLSNK